MSKRWENFPAEGMVGAKHGDVEQRDAEDLEQLCIP